MMQRFYIGTYTNKGSEGIYTALFDSETRTIRDITPVASLTSPTFLAVNREKRRLYAAGGDKGADGKQVGKVIGYHMNPESGALTAFTEQSTGRGRACHVDLDDRNVLIADYGRGSATVFPVDAEGLLGPASAHAEYDVASGVNARRQERAHAHSINLHPTRDTVYVPDLGGDRIYQYRLDRGAHTLEPLEPPFIQSAPGAGPRHMAFHPNGHQAAVINELNGSISSYTLDPVTGAMTEVHTVATLPKEFAGDNTCADIHFSPDGRFVYGSNRGHDSIVVYAYDDATARMNLIQREGCGGAHPRNFALTPDGGFLLVANRDSDNIAVLTRDAATGLVADTGHRASVSMPVCIKWA